jgi:hypothetical protein
MQLDALLQTLECYAPYDTVDVLYAERGDETYRVCRQENDQLIYWQADGDTGFEAPVREFLERHDRVVFHTDDDLFFASPPRELLELDNSETIVSLRLGRNTTRCHPLSCWQPVPERFPWRWRDARLDFAYPLSLNATVYNSRDLLPLLDFSFSDPTELEARLAANADRLEVEWMTAPERSCVVSLPHNVTSLASGNPRGSWPDYQPEALRRAYLAGWRIDPFAMDYTAVDAAHVELPYVFERRG